MTFFLEILKEGNIELRHMKPTLELAQDVFKIVDRNRTHLEHWLPWVDKIKTVEDEYVGLQKSYEMNWPYLIFANDELAGFIDFIKRDEKRKKLEIAYWLDQNFTGQGIMTRAIKLVENMAFETGAWNKIEIQCDVSNNKSRNVIKRAGYIFEGTLRQEFPKADGVFEDIMIFSKLKSEWRE
ncbi:MAG: GNAT family N-acetyltransferase [Lactobacillales bacterium]|jgi:ribosomal-protein-serine acetyltransferase|nr:GNAT family N-acetyltransferase [Lactobacillales bacterium]